MITPYQSVESQVPILICSSGQFHRNDAENFIKRHPNLDIWVASDQKIVGVQEEKYIKIEGGGFGTKIEGICACELEEFLYVDTDTTIHDLSWLSFYRERYSLCAAFDPIGKTEIFKDRLIPYELAPVEYNTGVLYVRKTGKVKQFLSYWRDAHLEGVRVNDGRFEDQISFRRAFFQIPLSLGVLPPNMNYRAMYSQLITGKVVISHSRRPASDALSKKAVNAEHPRYFVTSKYAISFDSLIAKFLRLLIRLL